MPPEFQLLRPLWLLALLPLALLLLFLWRRRGRDQAWRGLVDAHLLPYLLVGSEGAPRRLPLILLGLAWLLAVSALAGPVWQRLPQPVFTTTAARVILLDLSPSMDAADLRPSRLARARFELLDLLRASEEGQVALVAFGPEPFLVSPLTTDARTIAAQVPRLATDLIPVPGPRRLDRALAMAGELLDHSDGLGGEVILITDGSGLGRDDAALEAARTLAGRGVRVSVLGVGTEEGAPIPDHAGGFVGDDRGGIRIARLEPEALGDLARAGQGRYVALDPGDGDTRALLDAGGLPDTRTLLLEDGLAADEWREEGPWLLLLILPLAALAFRRGWLVPGLALALVLPPDPAMALSWDGLWQRPDQRAAQALERGDPEAAAAGFRDPAWRAAAHYRAGDYAGALEALEGQDGPDSDYNRGNALARLGELDAAIAAYQRTLEVAPGHADARANLELLERLKQEQESDSSSKDQQHGQNGQAGEDGQSGEGGDGEQSQDQAGEGADGQSGQESANDQASGGGQGDPAEGAGDTADPHGGPDARPRAEGAVPDDGAATADASPGPEQGEQGATAGGASERGEAPEPHAGDLGADAVAGEPEAVLEGTPPAQEPRTGDGDSTETAGDTPRDAEPVGPEGTTAMGPAGVDDLRPGEREARQALEAQLRRVPDDPAGLLRQRFLLQHLRREGRLQ